MAQAELLQGLQEDVASEGVTLSIAVVNPAGSPLALQALVDATSSPVFQDTWTMSAWSMHDGKKDDFYVYTPQGTLAAYFTLGGELNLDLSSDEGYQNIREAILNAN